MLRQILWDFLKRNWQIALLVFVLQLLQSLTNLLLPGMTANIIDNGIVTGDVAHVWKIGAVMLVITAIQGICLGGAIYFAARLAMSLGRELRERTFRQVMRFGVADVAKFGPSSLVTRATNDAQQLQNLLFMLLSFIVITPFMSIGGIIMAVLQDAKLSLLLLVVVPVLGALVLWVTIRLGPMFERLQLRLDETGQVLRDQLTGVRVIRAFNRQERERKRFAVTNSALRDQTLQIAYTFAAFMPLVGLIIGISNTAVVWFGAGRVVAGGMEIGSLVAYLYYLIQIMVAVLMSGMVIMIVPRARVSARRMSAVWNTVPDIKDPETAQPLPAGPHTFQLHDATVTFGNAEGASLDSINLTLAPGTTTAIVGPTGSGKSTLINLLPRFLDPSRGSVTINGVDLRDLPLAQVRSLIALAPQTAYLFAGTIASNVASVREEEVDEGVRAQVRECLEIADAWEFVEARENQVDAKVDTGGAGYSGGQRQRLTIARAVYKLLYGSAKLLVIDDSFSALDLATDARVRANIEQKLPDCGKLIVAQRLSTIIGADQILVLDDGQPCGLGTHEDLMDTCATYQQIAQSQLEGERL